MPRKIKNNAIEDVKEIYITKGRPDKNTFIDYINFEYIPEQVDNDNPLYNTGDELTQAQFDKLISMETPKDNEIYTVCGNVSNETGIDNNDDESEQELAENYDEHKSKISDALRISIDTALTKANAMKILADQAYSQAPLYATMDEDSQEEYRNLAAMLEKSKVSKELKDLAEAINYLQGQQQELAYDPGDRVIVLNDFTKSILNEKD